MMVYRQVENVPELTFSGPVTAINDYKSNHSISGKAPNHSLLTVTVNSHSLLFQEHVLDKC